MPNIVCPELMFEISKTFTVGLAYPYLNFQLFMTFTMIVFAALHITIPLIQSYYILIMTFVINGFIGGLVNSSGNIFLLELWGKENAPFFQTVQGMFGLGAFIAPLIVRPFIMELTVDVTDIDGESTNALSSTSSQKTLRDIVTRSQKNETISQIGVASFERNDLKIQYSYWITATCLFIPAIYYFFLWWFHPHSNPHPSRMTSGIVDSNGNAVMMDYEEDNKRRYSARKVSVISNIELRQVQRIRKSHAYLRWKIIAIGLMMLFMPIYNGLELTYGQYLTPFAVKSDLHLSKTTGTEITSVYWAMFTFFRVLAALYIGYIGSEKNVILNIGVILLSNVFLVPLASRYEWCLWTGSILMGMGCSSLWGSGFGCLEDYFPVSPRIGSSIVIATGFGEIIFPFIISAYIKTYPNILLVITLICSLSMAFIFAMFLLICKIKLQIKLASGPKPDVIQDHWTDMNIEDETNIMAAVARRQSKVTVTE